MRVTEAIRFNDLQRSLQSTSSSLSTIYEKLATQREVTRLSDDPAAGGTILRLRSQLDYLKEKSAALTSTQTFIDTTVSSLDIITDKMIEVRTMSVNAANGTLGEQDTSAIAAQVDELLESLIQNANEKYDDRYLYGGTATETQPFTTTRDANGQIVGFTYNGSNDNLTVPIGTDRTMQISMTGQELFVDSGAIQSLINFRDHLTQVDSLTTEEFNALMTADGNAIDAAQESITTSTGKLAARASELDLIDTQTTAAITRAEELLSEKEDVDMAQLAIDLERENMIYEAVLNSSKNLFQVSLMDYI